MYTKRIQLANYGPIENIDLSLPFNGDRPLPAIFIGENGSGKTVLLSHVINGLLSAQQIAFPDTPEVDLGKVYKLRSSTYITSGADSYCARVDYEQNFHIEEFRLARPKNQYPSVPRRLIDIHSEAAWDKISDSEVDHYYSNINNDQKSTISDIFSKNCILYFPANRFEHPAWLNEKNLNYKANYMRLQNLSGHTDRRVINISCLEGLQNWLFDLIYDRAVFETQVRQFNNLAIINDDQPVTSTPISMPLFMGYQGEATCTYDVALSIVRNILRLDNSGRFGIGRRKDRIVSVMQNDQNIVPNIFQLSSGEMSLLTLFLSILRDFDLSGTPISSPDDVRGAVVIDEIDLHLNAVHQYEVLPKLIAMFPRVQFLVTSHSPLFVLGLQEKLGDDGYGLYRLPSGQGVYAEEFGEFGEAYRAFKQTAAFASDMRDAIEQGYKPIVFVDGETDILYLHRAAELLKLEEILEKVELKASGGEARQRKTWNALGNALWEGVVGRKVVFLHDCDSDVDDSDQGTMFRRVVGRVNSNPIQRGIENLFGRDTLVKAIEHKVEFIDISCSYTRRVRGAEEVIPESWVVNGDEKMNLCRWLCENGTEEDFRGMQVVFEILQSILGLVVGNGPEVGK